MRYKGKFFIMYSQAKKGTMVRKGKSNPKRSRWIKPFWILYSLGVLAVVMIFSAISLGWFGFMPSFSELENPKTNLASEVYACDGALLGKYYIENRSPCKYEELSESVINALIATEDARYYRHSGIDIRALARVFVGVVTGNHKGGGSTITQQLAKNLFPRDPNANKIKLIITKLKESFEMDE